MKCNGRSKDVSYGEEVIMDQVIRGISNPEIQKEVLSQLDTDTLILEKLLTFVEGKESRQASQGLLSCRGTGGGFAVHPNRKCSYCGDRH